MGKPAREICVSGDPIADLVGRVRRPMAGRHLGAAGLEMRHHLIWKSFRPMCSCQARERRNQRVVMGEGILDLVVPAFQVVRLDAVRTERDSFRDENTGAGLAVILAEQAARHRHREIRNLREQPEPDLRFHLSPATVAAFVVEITRELHEQVFRKVRVRVLVGNGEHCLATCATPAERLELPDRGDAVIRTHRSRRTEGPGQEGGPCRAQRIDMNREIEAEQVPALPIRTCHEHPCRRPEIG